MDVELMAEICNKLTAAKTALEMLAEGKEVPREFARKALEDLNEGVRLIQSIDNK